MTTLSDGAVDRLRAAANWPEFADGRYAVTAEIGRGGMGTVYVATDETLGREVAIKVSNAIVTTTLERRLAVEARVLARLEHPGIVPVHDIGHLADGQMFYVMKRVRGHTLTEQLQASVDLSERLRIFERICETVAFAHAHGIIHRDLKPDNVMIGAYGEVMVMDWGAARASGDASQGCEPTVLGTVGFMAPEQADTDRDGLDERADVYSLGVILALLIGANGPRPLLSICARATAASSGDRYPTATALGDEIARFRAGRAVKAHRETVVERATRLGRVYRTPIVLVVAYMVMRAAVAWTTGW